MFNSQLQLRLLKLTTVSFLNFASTLAVGKVHPVSACVQVSDNRDSPALIFQVDIPWTGHPNHGVSHAAVTVDHVSDNFFQSALGDKVARTQGGLPQQARDAENLTMTSLESVQITKDLKPQNSMSGHRR